ncbi:MAG: hypothetical protein JXD22_15805 [Sedimentisphaerales bacterium]|nr:hypothetical protein [Sedimentisphaerales bacterium]
MAKNSCMGLHYNELGITAVLLEKRGSDFVVAESFRVVPEAADEKALSAGAAVGEASAGDERVSTLVELFGQESERRDIGKPAVVLTLSGKYYQNQFHHSEFSEEKQLRQTIRFDVEDDFTAEVESLAIGYQRLPMGDVSGSDLILYTVERNRLEPLLRELDEAGYDALTAWPDIAAWLSYLKNTDQLPQGESVLATAYCYDVLYILLLDADQKPILSRSVVCSSGQDLSGLLIAEVQRSVDMMADDEQPVRMLYHGSGFTAGQIATIEQETSLQCEPLKDKDAAGAFAAGAAMSYLSGRAAVDFREDGMQPRSLTESRSRAWYGFAAAVTILLVMLLLVMKMQTARYRSAEAVASDQIRNAYVEVMGKKPGPSANISRHINTEYKMLRDKTRAKVDRSIPGSASHTMTLVMGALADLGEDFDLDVQSLRVKAENAMLSGSFADMASQIKFDEAVNAVGQLKVERWDFVDTEDARRNFNTTIRVLLSGLEEVD